MLEKVNNDILLTQADFVADAISAGTTRARTFTDDVENDAANGSEPTSEKAERASTRRASLGDDFTDEELASSAAKSKSATIEEGREGVSDRGDFTRTRNALHGRRNHEDFSIGCLINPCDGSAISTTGTGIGHFDGQARESLNTHYRTIKVSPGLRQRVSMEVVVTESP